MQLINARRCKFMLFILLSIHTILHKLTFFLEEYHLNYHLNIFFLYIKQLLITKNFFIYLFDQLSTLANCRSNEVSQSTSCRSTSCRRPNSFATQSYWSNINTGLRLSSQTTKVIHFLYIILLSDMNKDSYPTFYCSLLLITN